MNFYQDILDGSHLAAGRLIKLIEDGDPNSYGALKKLYPHGGNAFIIGITGPPGAGKSTLFDRLIAEFRADGKKVAVLVFDPTSPLTGGAILGDRIRMNRHSSDSGVFIRSLATRGALGGISRAAKGATIVLDAMKHDVILIETAGLGQIGADISLLAHMTMVVCIPGMGDGMQAIKAGTLELADLYVVNKADLPGAEDVKHDLESMLKFKLASETTRQPEIVLTSATQNRGVDELRCAIVSFQQRIKGDPRLSEKARHQTTRYLEQLIKELAADCFWCNIRSSQAFLNALTAVETLQTDPYSAARDIVGRLLEGGLKNPDR
ncbi:GTPase [Desulfosarcina ovata subsp. sediminis]|uniref:GTPase n=1 Tax=Desulfosarcina ovata subsp. sediminis TaxID=885957 RepID=A0A5K7ZXU0_9BACT|nr:methylmalonyl Co-A mutase-associated GTPase MeaB [Desulfosarcina ovata]BBO85095.1 GTPase [Desulfosarcina ovata subsp. sediminis]